MDIRGAGFGAVFVIGALIGCGGGGGGGGDAAVSGNTGSGGSSGGGAFTTSVNSSTKLTALTADQARQLCQDLGNYVQGSYKATNCRVAGAEAAYAAQLVNSAATNADLRTACTSGYNRCLTADGGTSGNCAYTQSSAVPSTCTATVGDLESCLSGQATAYEAAPSCSEVTTTNVGSVFADGGAAFALPATCAMIFSAQCGAISSTN